MQRHIILKDNRVITSMDMIRKGSFLLCPLCKNKIAFRSKSIFVNSAKGQNQLHNSVGGICTDCFIKFGVRIETVMPDGKIQEEKEYRKLLNH
mgnify:CR=1 FL=1